jgi:hypothetical protein
MRGPAGWVINLGGRFGTPGIAGDDNTVSVKHARQESIDQYPLQAAAIQKLEDAGFEFASWFNAHDPEDEWAKCATMVKRVSSYEQTQCEVDPQGFCNGLSVEEFLGRGQAHPTTESIDDRLFEIAWLPSSPRSAHGWSGR